MPMPTFVRLLVSLSAALLIAAAPAAAQTAKERYDSAQSREGEVRRLLAEEDVAPAERSEALRQVGRLVSSYEGIVRRYPTSGYADNALWQGASLAEAAYRRFGRADDRSTAVRLYSWLAREYPTSPLLKRARTQVNALEKAETIEAALPTAPSPPPLPPPAQPMATAPASGAAAQPAVRPAGPSLTAAPTTTATAISAPTRAMLTDIQRVVLQDSVRITLELDREVPYYEERINCP